MKAIVNVVSWGCGTAVVLGYLLVERIRWAAAK